MFRAAVFHVKHCRLFCGGEACVHGFCRDTACRVRRKRIVQKQKDSEKLSQIRLIQLSTVGEVFLEGE